MPASKTLKAKAIAYSLGCPLCVGPNRYRTGIKEPAFVDTVFFGTWRREVFDDVGLFNEEFLREQDLEFNMRLKKAGYRRLLEPGIRSYYYPRKSFGKLFKMMFQYDCWKNLVNKKLKMLSSTRQLLPPVFVLHLCLLLILIFIFSVSVIPLAVYLALVFVFSLSISVKMREIAILPFSMFSFIVSHLAYGAGHLKGFWGFCTRKKSGCGGSRMETTR